jgi:hypothetical protein
MSFTAIIPQLWTARLLANLNNEHVYAALHNRDYTGEISGHGDTVRISTIGRITEAAYARNSTNISLENLDFTNQTLQITEDRYFGFTVDDADEIQASVNGMDAAMGEAAFALADRADTYAGEGLRDGTATANRIGAVAIGTGVSDDNPFEVIVDLGVKLDQNNVPSAGRWVVVSPEFYGVMVKDPRKSSFGTGGNLDTYKNGDVGMVINGMKVYKSNNVPAGVTNSSAEAIIAGHTIGATWAEQIPLKSFEVFRPEDRFEDAVKGRYLYGRKSTRATAFAFAEATYS